MEKITFYSITPLFKFELDPSTSVFSHTGTYKNARYEIKIVKPEQGPTFSDTLMPWADEETVESCGQIHLSPGMRDGAANFFLTVDVTREYTEELKVSSNTIECVEIGSAILDALRLTSSKGLLFYNTYNFRSVPHPYTKGETISSSLIDQYIFSHLGNEPSVLGEDNFVVCSSVFEKLLNELHNSDNESDKLLELISEYHLVLFKLAKVEHGFLILMIMFESMFKEVGEGNIVNASSRIGEKLGNTRAEKDDIRRDFDDNVDNTFGKLRNKIAHGDSSLDLQIVKTKYPVLYGYITKAIIKHIENL